MSRQKEVLHVFKVRPQSTSYVRFPIDMLRYDRCRPASKNDSVIIARSLSVRRSKGASAEDFEIQLAANEHKNWTPTEGRWKSFGWEVVSHGRLVLVLY